jgi:hypothetical protein
MAARLTGLTLLAVALSGASSAAPPPLGYAAEPDLAPFGPDVFSAAAPPPPAR